VTRETFLRAAHERSIRHRDEIEKSALCGCFHCLKTFLPQAIDEWIDGDQTALCPSCGIDSVLGDAGGLPITKELLSEMRAFWFDR
jgi:hypothetical protein